MSLGKDSVQKRIAKTDAQDKAPAAETAKQPAQKPAAKKPSAPKKPRPQPADVSSTVMGNVSPATVEAVIGRKETADDTHISITDDMPVYLL